MKKKIKVIISISEKGTVGTVVMYIIQVVRLVNRDYYQVNPPVAFLMHLRKLLK